MSDRKCTNCRYRLDEFEACWYGPCELGHSRLHQYYVNLGRECDDWETTDDQE